MQSHHWLLLVIVLAVGYILGKKFPAALSGIPVIGKYI